MQEKAIRVILSVTSDLSTDQRVHKIAQTLAESGYKVTVVGRKKFNSTPLTKKIYKTKRLRTLFEKSFLFYLEFNVKLFFYLLYKKVDLLWANDLDTLLPNVTVGKIKNKKIIYDAHEFFRGVPELRNRPLVRSLWTALEKQLIPQVNACSTVNDSIAKLFSKFYNIKPIVIRNLPYDKSTLTQPELFELLPAKHSETAVTINFLYEVLKTEPLPILLYQGAINKDRGVEELIEAMQFIPNAKLLIVGTGDVFQKIKNQVSKLDYKDKIIILGKIPMEKLPYITQLASLGLSLEKPTNLNYIYASPNKVVDYIQAQVPVLASPLVEIKKIIEQYKIGFMIENHNPEHIAEKINTLLDDKKLLKQAKANCYSASTQLTWENEKQKVTEFVESVLN